MKKNYYLYYFYFNKRKTMKKLTLFIALLVISTFTFASGGKNNNPWQPVIPDEPTGFLPSGLDTDNCDLLANEQGGKTYLCDYGVLGNVTVFVPSEDDDD